MDVVIFANGVLNAREEAINLAKQADLIIAVDGGANHCRSLGITPHILLGDLDSIDPELLQSYEQNNVTIHRYPVDKDKTDLELACDLAITKQATRVTILAALGGRWDMSFANLLLLAAPRYIGVEILLVDQETTIGVCRGGETRCFTFPPGTTISLLPINGDVTGVTLSGFRYPLTNETLNSSSSRGISNVLTEETGQLTVESGILLWMVLSEGKHPVHSPPSSTLSGTFSLREKE
jgi:thiamine pyrophosphokinase